MTRRKGLAQTRLSGYNPDRQPPPYLEMNNPTPARLSEMIAAALETPLPDPATNPIEEAAEAVWAALESLKEGCPHPSDPLDYVVASLGDFGALAVALEDQVNALLDTVSDHA